LKEVFPPIAVGVFGVLAFFSSTGQTIMNIVK
jgi:hypothetical protein